MTACMNAGDDKAHAKRPIVSEGPLLKYTGPRTPRCTTCARAERLRVRKRSRAAYAERVYNLSEADSDGLWEFQGKRCAICQRPVKVRAAANDHDHRCCPGPTSCGKCVRGKLCKPCNSMLAHARDSVQFFVRAARYLLDPPAPRFFKERNRL